MLIRSQTIYRTEALEFQRRRLTGEVVVEHSRRLWLLCVLFLLVSLGIVGSLWMATVPVHLSSACRIAADGGRSVDILFPGVRNDGSDRIQTIDLRSAGRAIGTFRIASQSVQGAGGLRLGIVPTLGEDVARRLSRDCNATFSIGMRPLASGLAKAFPALGSL